MPAGLPGVITVAAADVMADATKAFPWSWSNYGQCVDIWAPGAIILVPYFIGKLISIDK